MTRPDWRDDAACKGTPDWWWYAPDGESDDTVVPEAQARCDICPVQKLCLEWALVNEDDGFWAGTTPSERRVRRKRAGIRLRRAIEVPLVAGVPELPPRVPSPTRTWRPNGSTTSCGSSTQGEGAEPWEAPPLWAGPSDPPAGQRHDEDRQPSEAAHRGDQ